MKYDLEDRTLKFAESIIELCKKVPQTPVTLPIISQLIRSATSIGANYAEANGASSKKDFKNKIFICKKEARETKYWLKLLTKAYPNLKKECDICLKEARTNPDILENSPKFKISVLKLTQFKIQLKLRMLASSEFRVEK